MPDNFKDPYAQADSRSLDREEPDGGFWDSFLGETLEGGVYGVASAIQNVAELPNIIPGVDYSLDNPFTDRFRPETAWGGTVGGVVSFTAGMYGGYGLLGKVGKFRKLHQLAKSQKRWELAEGAAVGAVADFAVFDGNEERLSNFIQEFPLLANPINEILSADQDDTELEGRLKNVVEGLGMGAIFDAIYMSVRGVKRQRAELKADPDAEKVSKALLEEAGGVEGFGEMARDVVDGADAMNRPQEWGIGEVGPQDLRKGPDGEPLNIDKSPKGRPVEKDLVGKSGQESLALLRLRFGVDGKHIRDVTKEWDRITSELLHDPDPDLLSKPDNWTDAQKEIIGEITGRENLAYFKDSESVGFMIRAMENVLNEEGRGFFKETVTNEESMDLAKAQFRDMIAAGPKDDMWALRIAARSTSFSKASALVRKELVFLRLMKVGMSHEIHKVAMQVRQGVEGARESYGDMLDAYHTLGEHLRTGSSDMGRGLQAHKISMSPTEDIDALAEVIGTASTKETKDKLLDQIIAATGRGTIQDAVALAHILKSSRAQRGIAVGNEIFINSILSGMRTVTVNFMGPMMASFYRPMENMVGGALTGNTAILRRSMNEFMGGFRAFGDSMRYAGNSMLHDRPNLMPGASIRDDPARLRGAFEPETFGLTRDSFLGSLVHFVGAGVRMPTRLIGGIDEFTRQFNFRGTAHAGLLEEAYDKAAKGDIAPGSEIDWAETQFSEMTYKGEAYSKAMLERRANDKATELGIEDPVDRIDFIQGEVDKSMNGSPWLDKISKAGQERALEVTLQTPLRPGTIAHTIQQAFNAHPQFRFIAPFIKTPANIMTFAAQRFDVAGMGEALRRTKFGVGFEGLEESNNRMLRDFASGDANRRSEAIGRLSSGVALTGSAVALAMSGKITGRGPTDPEQRRILSDAGWMPYSFRTPDGNYIQYLRMDPFATFFGTVADMAEVATMAGNDDMDDFSLAVKGLAVATANNFTQKSFLEGIQKFFELLTDPAAKWDNYIEQYAGALVPNTLAQAVGAFGDREMKEVNSISEKLRSRIPGLAEGVAPQRNLLGEPMQRDSAWGSEAEGFGWLDMVQPVAYRRVKDDTISQELATLQHGFSPPKKKLNGLDLLAYQSESGQSAYDRWSQLHGEVRVGGRNLRQALRALIRSKEYQGLSAETTVDFKSPRAAMIQRVVGQYRRSALDATMSEYGDLRRDLQERDRAQMLLRQGVDIRELQGSTPTGVRF